MATKADFTEDEWQTLAWAVADAQHYAAESHRGFLESFREANAAERFAAEQEEAAASALMRALAADVGLARDPELKARPKDFGDIAIRRLQEAIALIQAKAPDELDGFREIVAGLAQATVGAAGGVDTAESDALAKIRTALG